MTASNDRSNNDPSAFDDKGQWVGGGQMTDYDYYNNKNTMRFESLFHLILFCSKNTHF